MALSMSAVSILSSVCELWEPVALGAWWHLLEWLSIISFIVFQCSVLFWLLFEL